MSINEIRCKILIQDGDSAPSPFADHDHIRAEALSGQREQVRGDKKAGMTNEEDKSGVTK